MGKMDKAVIFIDGYCNLCNGLLRKVLKADKRNIFRFSSIQGETYHELAKREKVPRNMDTVVLYDEGRVFLKSKAVFEIASRLGGLYKILLVFRVLPKALNDNLYDLVARLRYRVFGKRDHCELQAGPALRDKFLD